jgi:transcriptional regulator with XRE-family HTH domain
MKLGEKIRKKRKQLGLTLAETGRRAGLSGEAVREIEVGARTGRLETLRAIARALRIRIEDLLR